MNKVILVVLLLQSVIQVTNGQNQITEIFNDVAHENIEINFSTENFEHYLVTERVANISNGEIFWLKEKMDTISIKCLKNVDNEVFYAVNESHNDWMGLLYERKIRHLLPETYDFPTIEYSKNRISKKETFPDSCELTKEIVFHLKQSVELLKEVGDYSSIKRYEKQIDKMQNCHLSWFNVLQQSRNILALDNYLVPVHSDTLKYSMIQLEHFGLKTNFESFKTEEKNKNTLIHLVQYDDEMDNKEQINQLIEANKESLSREELDIYQQIKKSIQSSNRALIELDENKNLIRFISKINSTRLNKDFGEEHRFYNYEIKKIDAQ